MTTNVVFLHGWLMSPDMWSGVIDQLPPDHRALAIAQPGHGAAGLGNGASMADWARWVLDRLDAEGIEEAVFVGHSMGGFLCQELWKAAPERFRALVLVGITDQAWPAEQQEQFLGAATMCTTSWSREIAEMIAGILVGQQFLQANPQWIDQWHDQVAGYDLHAIADLCKVVATHPSYEDVTPTISVPTLVVHGTDDQAVPFELGQSLASHIPHSTLVSIDGCGHAPSLEKPAETGEAIRTFLTDAMQEAR